MSERIEKGKEYVRELSLRQKIAIGASVLPLVVSLQVAKDQSERPKSPTVKFYNPITWVASPVSNWIEGKVHLSQDINQPPQFQPKVENGGLPDNTTPTDGLPDKPTPNNGIPDSPTGHNGLPDVPNNQLPDKQPSPSR